MPTVNFYLKKAEPTTGRSLIFLQFKYSGQRLVFSFGQTIPPRRWNAKKQRVKSNADTTADGDHSLNELLDNLERVCLCTYKDEVKNGVPPPEVIKRQLVHFMNQHRKTEDTPTLFKLIDRFIAGEIKREGEDKSPATLKVYKTTKWHLEAFAQQYRYPIDFDTITLDFFHRYVAFLKEGVPRRNKKTGALDAAGAVPMKKNTLAKSINTLKVFMNEAVTLGYTTNLQFRHKKFNIRTEESDSVYLSEQELLHLYRHDFSANKRLEQVRDLFVFGCHVGLRFGDYSSIKPENIVTLDGEYFLKVKTGKTDELVIIPCNPIVLEIFEKYQDSPNRLPKALSNQKFNNYIKEACRVAGLTEKGRLLTAPERELWECISSHTARRSFATNLYLSGFPAIEIMKITGHRTEKAFLKYIRITKLDAARRMGQHMKRRWIEKLHAVA